MNQSSATKRPRILVVSATVGSGHNTAAKAIIAGLGQRGLDADVEFVDILTFTPWWFRAYYAGGFALLMTRLGWLYGLGFRLFNRPHTPQRSLSEKLRMALELYATRRFQRFVLDNPPDLIVHTHFLGPMVVSHLRRQGRLDAPQFVVATDIDIHRWWYAQPVERYFLPMDSSAEPLLRWGVERDRITVSGIPIRPAWSQTPDLPQVRAQWNLPPDRKVVLLAGGAEFTVGPVVKIARGIARACPNAYVVVLAGRNKQLLGDLAKLPEAPRQIVGVGFTDRVHELVAAASLMVTKAGGITTAECVSTGTPMVLMNPVPGQEGGNAHYLVSHNAAVVARGTRAIISAVRELLDDDARLAELARNARHLHRPGLETIVSAIEQWMLCGCGRRA